MKTVYEIYYHETKQTTFIEGKYPMFKCWDIKEPQVNSVSFYPGFTVSGEQVNLISITVDKPFFVEPTTHWVSKIITPTEIEELANEKIATNN